MSVLPPSEIPKTTPTRLQKAALIAFDVSLVILILIGVYFRFNWVNWNQDTDLHPDEYGLTGTLTQLSIPQNLADYFNTRMSPISPYQKYDEAGNPTVNGPDNRMRWGQWPIIIIRVSAEITGNSDYGNMRLLGRGLSALADALGLLFIFLIGARLYGRRAGLLAAALSSQAVMQIQQSHFMTVDNFAVFFTMVAMYACVRIAQAAPLARLPEPATRYHPVWQVAGWYTLFGIAFGMALASKVNLLPLGGMVLVAAFISVADLGLKSQDDLRRILGFSVLFLSIAVFASLITFRVTQPMSFRAPTGNTSILTLQPNKDWVDSMLVAQAESSGEGGGPPGEQWAHRPAIIFPLVNMVAWGMGLPLGLACWLATLLALWQVARGRNWRAHLLPLVWVLGDFIFLGTRWVKSVRYFLPIYPFLCLLAAWALLELWRRAQQSKASFSMGRVAASLAMGITILGAFAWATAYTQAVYVIPHTRIQAARWIFQNIPGPFELAFRDQQGNLVYQQLPAPDGLQINSANPYTQSFSPPVDAQLTRVTLPHAQADGSTGLRIIITSRSDGSNLLGETRVAVTPQRAETSGQFQAISLKHGETYYLTASVTDPATVNVYQTVLSNESWDESLPMRLDGYDPFGGIYRGLSMEVRWPDAENKKQMFLDTISQTDYIIMPSQRAIWSVCRIPLTYPMTMDYYRALFDGRLGFDQVAAFSAPLKFGPLEISDVGGSFAWNHTPALPLFNHSGLAAEEAFSVYDHPPVWIFKKRADFNIAAVKTILDATDLTRVVDQGPLNAAGDWCPPN